MSCVNSKLYAQHPFFPQGNFLFYIAIQPINNVVMGSCLEGDQLSQLSGTEEQKKVEFTGDWS